MFETRSYETTRNRQKIGTGKEGLARTKKHVTGGYIPLWKKRSPRRPGK